MHDGMQYDPIQRQGQGHEPLKVENSAIFFKKAISYNGAGKWWPRILKLGAIPMQLIGAGFVIFVLVFVSRDFEGGSK